jgi:hypothetical protein
MQETIEAGVLPDDELLAREAALLEAWIDADATRVAAQARRDAALRQQWGTRSAARALQAAQAAEQTVRAEHRALSDELVRRGLTPQRPRRAA